MLFGAKKSETKVKLRFFLTLQVISFLMSPKTSLFCQKWLRKQSQSCQPPLKREKSMRFVHIYTIVQFYLHYCVVYKKSPKNLNDIVYQMDHIW